MFETVELIPGNTLITATPQEGRELAIKMARLIIKVTQPDAEIRGRREVFTPKTPQC
ncbi:hexameric tyrosine-coordinated heme protein [Mucilaginibacter sp. SMC90]|nr:hexameric tyrosine-coordinated heme protein [Mucilaginibacter sp. SMC90]UOE47938.1 hexameric tyrosine-coordinated heme protein [Mucilaginibacter sp. SMC90]